LQEAAVRKADESLDSIRSEIQRKEEKKQDQRQKIARAETILALPKEDFQREHNSKIREKVGFDGPTSACMLMG